tara:strand:- start:68 stop:307 length:240 start_codon:yes stop_codon:yes gene_type:complete
MKIEKLDVDNIIEIKQIRGLLHATHRPELLTMFELLCRTANKKINDEKGEVMDEDDEEEYIEPELESDSDDDIIETPQL